MSLPYTGQSFNPHGALSASLDPDKPWTVRGTRYNKRDDYEPYKCPLCQTTYKYNKTKYLQSIGGQVCVNCYKDAQRKPCSECFMIHSGECL